MQALSDVHARLIGTDDADQLIGKLMSGSAFAMDVHAVGGGEGRGSYHSRHLCSLVYALYFASTEAGHAVSYLRLDSAVEAMGEEGEGIAREACVRMCEEWVEAGTLCALGGYASWTGGSGVDADAVAVQHLLLEGMPVRIATPPQLVGWCKP